MCIKWNSLTLCNMGKYNLYSITVQLCARQAVLSDCTLTCYLHVTTGRKQAVNFMTIGRRLSDFLCLIWIWIWHSFDAQICRAPPSTFLRDLAQIGHVWWSYEDLMLHGEGFKVTLGCSAVGLRAHLLLSCDVTSCVQWVALWIWHSIDAQIYSGRLTLYSWEIWPR